MLALAAPPAATASVDAEYGGDGFNKRPQVESLVKT